VVARVVETLPVETLPVVGDSFAAAVDHDNDAVEGLEVYTGLAAVGPEACTGLAVKGLEAYTGLAVEGLEAYTGLVVDSPEAYTGLGAGTGLAVDDTVV